MIAVAALFVAAATAVSMMLIAAEGKFDAGALLFLGWAISPYACFYALSRMLGKFTSIPHIAFISCVISLLMLAFTLFAYIGALRDASSTSALVFLFVPLWLYIGSFVLLAIGAAVALLTRRREE